MRLDNIIYDKDTLESAIIEQWSNDSPLFNAMYPSETTTSLANLMAAYGAMLQYTLVSCLANCYTPTAFSESAVYQLAQTLGNDLHGNVSAQVKVDIEKNNFIGIATNIPKETIFTIDNKKFFNPSKIIFPASVNKLEDIVLVQGEMIEVTKTSNGIPNEKFYFSSDFMANHNYISVYVNGEEWNVVDSFLDYDKDYVLDPSELNSVVLKTDPDGRAYIKVGDNQLANMPASGSKISIKYVSNDGADGNIGEIGTEGVLASSLVYLDNTGNQDTLDIKITTTTTAYGGFSKQSIDMLRLTSPYIFASGHRAVRRKDYEAILANKCGYITSSVWGEYEEAAKEGAYDAIMMNMVYYTGLKTFQEYPQFLIGTLDNKYKYEGRANGRRGFEGSFSFRLYNDSDTTVNPILLQDTGAKGQVFINDNDTDPRDSLLPDWIMALNKKYEAFNAYLKSVQNSTDDVSTYIRTKGSNYAQGDELFVDYTFGQIKLRVIAVNNQGGVEAVKLLDHSLIKTPEIVEKLAAETSPDLPHTWSEYIDFIMADNYYFATSYVNGIEIGTGFTLNLGFRGNYGLYDENTGTSTFITTNDLRTGTETQLHPVQNLMSNTDNLLYYQSLYRPTLQNPVQIIVSYIYPNTTAADDSYNQPISAIKFKACSESEGTFPGTFAVFGTTEYPMPSLENIRNSTHWDKLIKRTDLTNPYGNINDGWTDWYPTSCFTGEYNSKGEPIYNGYKFYVIEFYSVKETSATDINMVTLSKMKFLYPEDSSVIYYNDNGIVDFNFPTAGSPGPSEDNSLGYLTKDLINVAPYPLYKYNIKLENIDSTHGYKAGNILAYVYNNEKTGNKVTFLVRISSVTPDSSVYTIYVNDGTNLCANEYVETANPVSLDKTLTFTVALNPNYIGDIEQSDRYGIVSKGGSYERNTLFTVDGSDGAIRGRIASVNAYGEVTSVVLLNTLMIGDKLDGVYDTTVIGDKPGAGLRLALTSTSNSGTGITTKVTETIVSTTRENSLGEKETFTTEPIYEYDTEYEVGTLVTTETYIEDQGTDESGDDITVTIVTTKTTYIKDTEASGATISIETENNLKVMTSFIGNKIDTDDITFLDQPIMNKYNHFTTFMQFVQPSISQLGIVAKVKIIDNAPISSGVVLQNVKNNIRELFNLTPDYVGKGLKISDIYKAVINTKYVKWCKIITPLDNVEVPVNGILMSSFIDLIEEVEDYEQLQ